MRLAGLVDPELEALQRHRGRPYGFDGRHAYDLYEEVLRHRPGDELRRITTPLLVCESDDALRWPGQARELHDRLPGPSSLGRFDDALAWLGEHLATGRPG